MTAKPYFTPLGFGIDKLLLWGVFVLLFTLIPVSRAAADLLFGTIGSDLVTVDQTTGDATLVGPTGIAGFSALTSDPNTGTLYGVTGGDPTLVTIDRCTGQGTAVGLINLISPPRDVTLAEGIAFNPVDGLLYGTVHDPLISRAFASDILVTIDPATGDATEITRIISPIFESEADGMVFIDGTLYAVDCAPCFLQTIDLNTGVASPIGFSGPGGSRSGSFNGAGDLAFNPSTGTLFESDFFTRRLLTIDPTSGEGTVVGPTHTDAEFGGGRLTPLAVAPPAVAPNQPPVANAGPDQTEECTSATGTPVMLDGSGSSDPDVGDTLSFEWKDSTGSVVGTTAVVNLTLPLGTHTFTLTVDDGQGETDSDTVVVTVEDTTPPNISAALVPVGEGDEVGDDDEGRFRISFSANDVCDQSPSVTAVLAVAGVPDIPVTDGQIIEFEFDDEDTEVDVEDGILEIEAPALTLQVTATDASGNTAVATAQPPGLSPDNDVPGDLDD